MAIRLERAVVETQVGQLLHAGRPVEDPQDDLLSPARWKRREAEIDGASVAAGAWTWVITDACGMIWGAPKRARLAAAGELSATMTSSAALWY